MKSIANTRIPKTSLLRPCPSIINGKYHGKKLKSRRTCLINWLLRLHFTWVVFNSTWGWTHRYTYQLQETRYVHTHIDTCAHTHAHMQTYVYKHIHTYVHYTYIIHAYMHIHNYAYTYIHTYIRTYI